MTRNTQSPHLSASAPANPTPAAQTARRAALDAAWPTLRPRLLRLAARLTHAQEADDMVQSTYLKAIAVLDTYHVRTGDSGMYRWLCSLLTNLCRHAKERNDRRNELLLSPTGFVTLLDGREEGVVQPDQEAAILLAELEAYAQIKGLRRRRREVWQLWREGYSQAEIAAKLGLTQQAISYHVGVVIDELRAAAGELITRADGYPSTAAMFNEHARVTIYRRPQRRGASIANRRIRDLK